MPVSWELLLGDTSCPMGAAPLGSISECAGRPGLGPPWGAVSSSCSSGSFSLTLTLCLRSSVMISRTLGPEVGGSIGLMFYLANVCGCAVSLLGLVEAVLDVFGAGPCAPPGSV